MTCVSEIHIGTINFDFVITISEDCSAISVSDATETLIYFTKPSGSLLVKTAVFVTDGTDGLIHYSTISGDLDEVGIWKMQAKVTFGASVYPSAIHTFRVYKNLF